MTRRSGLVRRTERSVLEVPEHERSQPGQGRRDGEAEVVDLAVGEGIGDALEGEEEDGVGLGAARALPATQARQEPELAPPLRPVDATRRLVGRDEGAQAGAQATPATMQRDDHVDDALGSRRR